MGVIDKTIKYSKKIESLLEERFNASGKGLHEKAQSVQDLLPERILKSIHWIATIRNKTVHEEDFENELENIFDEYMQACEEVIKELEILEPQKNILQTFDESEHQDEKIYASIPDAAVNYSDVNKPAILDWVRESYFKVLYIAGGLFHWVFLTYSTIKGFNPIDLYASFINRVWSPTNDIVLNFLIDAAVIIMGIISIFGFFRLGIYVVGIAIFITILKWLASLSKVGAFIAVLGLIGGVYFLISKIMNNRSNGSCANAISLIVAIIFVSVVAFGYFAIASSGFSSFPPISITSNTTPGTESPDGEKISTPSPVPTTNSSCPSWKSVRKDLSGNRFDIWKKYVSNQPSAIEWEDFKDQSLICNPILIKDNYVFIKGKEYILP